MKSLGVFILSFFLGQGDFEKTEPLDAGKHTRTIEIAGVQRSFIVHVPATYDPRKPTPLVLALHGATMTASLMESFTGLNKKADEAGFIVVYPNGTGPGNLFLTWNSGGFAPALAKKKPDDVAFIAKVLDDVEKVVNVDKKRVFACGLSNGGMMCYRLAAELSDRIAAIASVAGTIAIEKPEPKRAVPVLHFHGTEDKLVPYSGPDKKVAAVMKFAGVEDSINAWVKLDGCDTEPKISVLSASTDKHEVTRKVYSGGKDGAEVVLYVVEGGGHTWPGRPFGGGNLLGAYTLNINANDLIWEFFERHPMKE
ncbi:MAG: prolyl oligopeptidase family serine peptidase [Planctomycetes bacterium]|nr:prolyl oligopeptidase family serine peptidase [Planctomycetota bacterium]